MHHHLFPTEDTYVTNRSGYEDKNFGINEILRIGTDNQNVRALQSTKDYSYVDAVWTNYCVSSFTGTLTGSFSGSAEAANGIVNSSASFSSSYFSGSLDGGVITEASGGFSGSLVGLITGSLVQAYIPNFSGSLTGSYGRITGTVTGIDTRNENHWTTTTTKFVDRTLMKFDLTTISTSISNGEIISPQFKLNLKVCNEYQLPISYKIYAFPVSQSWIMGNGYYSDGGSDVGASWYYRDYASGSLWYSPINTSLRPVVDFLNVPANATASFAYGGGTWNYADANTSSSQATQSFNYEAADISMDVTNIVMSWISGTLPNEGFILMSSDEIVNSGSGFSLTFYAKDTNSINSPYLDIMWDDWSWSSGSVGTSSVEITTHSGMDVTAQTGSTFTFSGGIDGTFSGSAMASTTLHWVTASNVTASGDYVDFSGSFIGSLTTNSASYLSGSVSGSITSSFGLDYFSGSIDGAPITEGAIGAPAGEFFYGILSSSVFVSGSISYFDGSAVAATVNEGAYPFTIEGTIVQATYYDFINYYAYGIVLGMGLTGNVAGLPVMGGFTGSLTVSQSTVTGPCGSTFEAQIVSASFTDGVFSGVQFSGYYVDGKFENAHISGSWPASTIVGAHVTIALPSGIDPYAYATVTSPFVWGRAFGTYLISGSISGSVGSESASFSGQFIEGPLVGGVLNLQLSGSVFTSSYSYTSSFETTSSGFTLLDTDRSFTVILKNLKPEYKGGDVARINVFGRREFPMKTFVKTSQQLGYLVPELLPTSSYYAIKDNMSEEIIVDFDNYTRISGEYPDGNFFMLDTTGLAQERPYRILVRIESSGSRYTFDNGDVFKITR